MEYKIPKRRIFIKFIYTIAVICVFLLAGHILLSFYIFSDIRAGKNLLLYEVNHKALLDNCRKVIKERQNGKWQEQYYMIKMHMMTSKDYNPEIDDLPARILILNPTYVRIYDDHVDIEMTGRFGVTAYAEEYSKNGHDKKPGDKILIDGLWFYNP